MIVTPGRTLYYYLTIGTLLLIQVAWMSNVARAQTDTKPAVSALSVSPAIIEATLTPGGVTPFTLTVRNVTNSPLPVAAFARAFTVQSSALEKTDQSRLDASEWFKVEESQFILQPNQEHIVKGVIRPPLGTEPGGHYATIFFQPLVSQDDVHPSMAKISARVGVLSFLTVKGTMSEGAILASPLALPKITHPGPIDLKFSIENTGNVHIMPKGTVDIYDWQGKRVAAINVPVGLILPSATKEYVIPWNTSTLFGKYRAELSLEYSASHVRLQNSAVTIFVLP